MELSEEEILEFLKDDDENNYQLGISATLETIIRILLANNITNKKEFQEIQKYCLERVKKEQIQRMSNEEKQKLEVIKKFNDLFGINLGGIGK